jgi:hypothetical protein
MEPTTTSTITEPTILPLFEFTNNTITKYNGNDENIIIPSIIGTQFIRSISQYAFKEKKTLKSLRISEGIYSISKYAFEGCNNLTSIIIPHNLTGISDMAFNKCNNLNKIIFNGTMPNFGIKAFPDTGNIIDVYHPHWSLSNTTKINSLVPKNKLIPMDFSTEENTIIRCNIKDNVLTIPYKSILEYELKIIGNSNNLFLSNTNITTTTINFKLINNISKITDINHRAFSRCTALTSINLPESITYIGMYAFSDCKALTSINLP